MKFKFEAGTSRGILTNRDTYYICLENHGITGVGEASPLKGLSVDYRTDFEQVLIEKHELLLSTEVQPASYEEISNLLDKLDLDEFPSIRFGFETALCDLLTGGKRKILNSDFYSGQLIPINGLIWMGDLDFMFHQLEEKLQQGFTCIKMKIGAIDFDQECRILESIRKRYSKEQIELRVDANGAFSTKVALQKLKVLNRYDIHSIEQPIQPRQWEEMKKLCIESPIKIALDEELIGVVSLTEKLHLLDTIKPPYIILKPTLVGGLKHCIEWIKFAEFRHIGWWMTSALESNIGLNAICQFAAAHKNPLPQGLGTGSLYTNNLDSPLTVADGKIFYDQNKSWGNLSTLQTNN